MLHQGGRDETERKVWVNFEWCQRDTTELKKRAQADVSRYGQPDSGHDPPFRPCERLIIIPLVRPVKQKVHADLKHRR